MCRFYLLWIDTQCRVLGTFSNASWAMEDESRFPHPKTHCLSLPSLTSQFVPHCLFSLLGRTLSISQTHNCCPSVTGPHFTLTLSPVLCIAACRLCLHSCPWLMQRGGFAVCDYNIPWTTGKPSPHTVSHSALGAVTSFPVLVLSLPF